MLARGYAIDDTYIHLQFARNLSGGHGLRFFADEPPVYACSSPLWVALLSTTYALGAGGPSAARLLSSVFAGIAAFLAGIAAGRILPGRRRSAAGAVMLLCMMDPWCTRWGASGMEASLAAALVVGWFLTATSVKPSPVLSGILAGTAFLARPELLFLGPLYLFLSKGGRRWAGLVPWALIVTGWTVFAMGYFGRLVPTAAAAKASGGSFIVYIGEEIPDLISALALTAAPLILAGFLARVAGQLTERHRGDGTWRTLLVPSVLIALLIAGRAPLVTRYMVPVIPLTLLGIVVPVLARIRTGRGLIAFTLAAVTVQAASGAAMVWPHMRRAAANMEIYHEVAGGITGLTPPGSLIAVQEIGVFGYESGRKLLDLGGLVSSDPSGFPGLQYDASGSVEFLRRHGATHLLDPHGAVEPLGDASDKLGVVFEPLGSWTFPGGTSLSGASTYRRVLYRLRWCER